MKRFAAVAVLLIGFLALAGMHWTTPRYVRITGPIAFDGNPGKPLRADNLVIDAGQPLLARTIRFAVLGKPVTRDSGGLWLVVPVLTDADRTTAHVTGRFWVTPDGRRFRASERTENGDAVLSMVKAIQPGLQNKSLAVFELPAEIATGEGTLLLSEEGAPQLSAQARIHYPKAAPAPAAAMLDLDELRGKL